MKRINKRGFTIVELVVVIAVIAILAAILIPTFLGLIRKANESAAYQDAHSLISALLPEMGGDADTDVLILTTRGGMLYIYGFDNVQRRVLPYCVHPYKEVGEEAFADVTNAALADLVTKGHISGPETYEADDWRNPVRTAEILESCGFDPEIILVRADYTIEDGFFAESSEQLPPVQPDSDKGIVMQSTLSLLKGNSLVLDAFLSPENKKATADDVTWTTSDDNVVAVSSVGAVQAVGNNGQTATVTVTRKDDSTVSASCVITVLEKDVVVTPPTDPADPTALSVRVTDIVAPDYLYFTVGETFRMVTDAAAGETVTWTYDRNLLSIDSNGNVECLRPGDALVTATAGERTGSLILQIREISVTSPISISDVSELEIGGEPGLILIRANKNYKGTFEITNKNPENANVSKDPASSPWRMLYKVTPADAAGGKSVTVEVKYILAEGETDSGMTSTATNIPFTIKQKAEEMGNILFSDGKYFNSSIAEFVGDRDSVRHVIFGTVTASTASSVTVQYSDVGDSVTIDLNAVKKANVTDHADMQVYWDSTRGTLYVVSSNTITAPEKMDCMFGDNMYGSTAFINLQTIDFYNFEVTASSSATGMFGYCESLERIYVKAGTDWTTNNVKGSGIFHYPNDDNTGVLKNDEGELVKFYIKNTPDRVYLKVGLVDVANVLGVFSVRTAD